MGAASSEIETPYLENMKDNIGIAESPRNSETDSQLLISPCQMRIF